MTRGEEALAYIPASLAAGAKLAPPPPLELGEVGEGGGEELGAGWVEARLHLLDYVQASTSGGWRV